MRLLAAVGQVAAPPRPLNLVWPLGSSVGDRITIRLDRPGPYRLWIGGSVRGRLTAFVNGTRVGSVSSQLQNAGQWLDLGAAELRAGTQVVALAVDTPPLEPGIAGGGFALGPLLLQPERTSRLVTPLPPTSLCGRSLDWLEALG